MSSRVQKLNRLLPVVAIGTIADCQSIVEPTNRMLAKVGIEIIKQGGHGINGITELMKQLGLTEKIQQGYTFTSQDIAFVLSPILNSSGRISHARLSILTLLQSYHHQKHIFTYPCTEDSMHLTELAATLIKTNEERKETVKAIAKDIEIDALNQVENGEEIIMVSGDWNKGVIGLIASRLVSTCNKPVSVVSTSNKKHLFTPLEINEIRSYLESL